MCVEGKVWRGRYQYSVDPNRLEQAGNQTQEHHQLPQGTGHVQGKEAHPTVHLFDFTEETECFYYGFCSFRVLWCVFVQDTK